MQTETLEFIPYLPAAGKGANIFSADLSTWFNVMLRSFDGVFDALELHSDFSPFAG